MNKRTISEDVFLLGAVDWNRRFFDSLIPLPDGTSYNAYLIKGSAATALIDTADHTKSHILMDQLKDVARIDYLIANHAEQDHSGTLPQVAEKYPQGEVDQRLFNGLENGKVAAPGAPGGFILPIIL